MAVLTLRTGGGRRPVAQLRRLRTWLIGLVLACASAPTAPAQSAPPAEYQVKAVFLFNFAQFVDWPAQAFHEPLAPLVIGVLGEDPFGTYLDDLVSGEKIGDRPLLVRRFKRVEELTDCHIVFICRSEARNLAQIVTRLKGQSLLTVSDADTFTRQGGMVRFATENGKIRLRINVEAAKACHLTISSKLLRPDTIATPGKD
jgi:hypothetical protein